MDLHNWIMEIHNSIIDLHNWIMEIHNSIMDLHNYGVLSPLALHTVYPTADGLATQGAKASVAMVLTLFSWKIPFSPTEGLTLILLSLVNYQRKQTLKKKAYILSGPQLVKWIWMCGIFQDQLGEVRQAMGASLSERYTSQQKGTAKVMAEHDRLRKDLLKVRTGDLLDNNWLINFTLYLNMPLKGVLFFMQKKCFNVRFHYIFLVQAALLKYYLILLCNFLLCNLDARKWILCQHISN